MEPCSNPGAAYFVVVGPDQKMESKSPYYRLIGQDACWLQDNVSSIAGEMRVRVPLGRLSLVQTKKCNNKYNFLFY